MMPAILLALFNALAHQCQTLVALGIPIQSIAAHSHHDSQRVGGYRASVDHNGEEAQDVINGEIVDNGPMKIADNGDIIDDGKVVDNGEAEIVDNGQVVDSGGGSKEFTIPASRGSQIQMRSKRTHEAPHVALTVHSDGSLTE